MKTPPGENSIFQCGLWNLNKNKTGLKINMCFLCVYSYTYTRTNSMFHRCQNYHGNHTPHLIQSSAFCLSKLCNRASHISMCQCSADGRWPGGGMDGDAVWIQRMCKSIEKSLCIKDKEQCTVTITKLNIKAHLYGYCYTKTQKNYLQCRL